MIGIVDAAGKRIGHRKLECDLEAVVAFLGPYQRRLKSVAVESTYNWYWLVDGLRALGYPVVLAKVRRRSGARTGTDRIRTEDVAYGTAAYFLAELQRLQRCRCLTELYL